MTWANDMRYLRDVLAPRHAHAQTFEVYNRTTVSASTYDREPSLNGNGATPTGKFALSLCAIGACHDCGRTLINAARSTAGSPYLRQSFLCARCFDWSSVEHLRIDHDEWLARRRAQRDAA